jgi:hypothetical protein
MRLFHKCEKKVYTVGEALRHEHTQNPAECLKGWRKATAKEKEPK